MQTNEKEILSAEENGVEACDPEMDEMLAATKPVGCSL